jgi:TonB family protein
MKKRLILYLLIALTMLVGCTTVPTKPENPEEIFVPSASGLSAGDALPAPIFQAGPLYPKELFDRKTPGEATVDFVIERDGSVQIAKAVSQTNELFGAAAVECVKKWKFKPALKGGIPARFRLQVPIYFTIQ